jgi:hypothetical protein
MTLFLFAAMLSCKSVSKYTIDEKPLIKTDSAFYGVWKAVEDTDKANYILIQSPYDIYHHVDWWYHMDSVKKRTYFDEKFLADPDRVRMAFAKDVTMLNDAYEEFKEKKDHYYYITYFNRHGKNPLYQQWHSFLSKVNNATFLNVPYRYVPIMNGHANGPSKVGFFFVRLIKISPAFDSITTAVVSDTTLWQLTSSKEVRDRLTKNMNKPTFYSDTLHFYKVSGYHLSLEESKQKAN